MTTNNKENNRLKSLRLICFSLLIALTVITAGCVNTGTSDNTNLASGEPNTVDPNFRIASEKKTIFKSEEANDPNILSLDKPLTLENAIDISLANNPSLAADEYGFQASLAGKDEAAGEALPEIHLEGGYTSYRDSRLIKPRRMGTSDVLQFSDELASGDIVISMPIYTGGRITNQIKIAQLAAQAKKQQLAFNKEELIFNVSSVYYSILSQKEVINSLLFSQKTLKEHHKKTRELLDSQKAAKVDLLRTDVRLADIAQQLIRERNVLSIKRSVLANLLGLQEDTGKISLAENLQLVDSPVSLENALAVALDNRQDYQALKSQVTAWKKRLEIAKSERLPEVSLRGSYGNRWDSDSSEDNEVGEIGIYAEMPIFEGGRIEAAIRRQRNNLKAQKESLRELEQDIRLEIETSSSNVESTFARIDVNKKAIEQAKESLRIEREKYELGKGEIVDVLDAQSALLSAQKNYYNALADYNTAVSQLRLATGQRR